MEEVITLDVLVIEFDSFFFVLPDDSLVTEITVEEDTVVFTSFLSPSEQAVIENKDIPNINKILFFII
ncbi:hypothetical protein MGA447_2506 [Enterococcus faecalis]|nr:hypothetical protein MGA447_2506 [Enterococcus faecalis]